MRLEATKMEPCITASPPKGEKVTTAKRTVDKAAGESLPSSPKAEKQIAGESSETQDNDRDASSSQQLPSSSRVAQHEDQSQSNHHHQQHDKMPLDHSAASSRTRRPFFLKRLSSSAGSKQRRLRNKEIKLQRRHSQPITLSTEARHLDESMESSKGGNNNENTLGDVSSPHSIRSSTTPTKRRRSKQPIKFLRRALSSPPILLQRFHSNPIEKDFQDNNSNHRRNRNNSRQLFRSNSGSSGSSCDLNMNVAERTRVVPNAHSPIPKRNAPTLHEEDEEDIETQEAEKAHCSATSILHHTYFPVLDTLCGTPTAENNRGMSFSDYPRLNNFKNQLYNTACMSDDPTVQESIECIFASQLEDGLKLWDDDDDDGIVDDDDCGPAGLRSFASLEQVRSSSPTAETLVSPAGVHQSRMNRKDRKDSSKSLLFANMTQTKKRYEQASLVYVGTFDPSTPKNNPGSTRRMGESSFHDEHDASTVYSNLPTDPLPCACHSSFLPSVEPKDWPQAPIALRPTPGKGTKVKAIRFSNSTEPLWVPGSHLTWNQRLEQHWGRQTEEELRKKRDLQPHYACCEECVLLPINNGNEKPGESLVTDFETEFFEGTLLLRIRYSEGTTPEPYDDDKGYFKGMNRRYQCCIRGRFKKALPFTQLTTGFRLDRQFGNLPSKWVIKSALKVVRFFAPQLDIKMEGIKHPYSRAPLGSTPQCINVDETEEEYQVKEISGCDNTSTSSDDDKILYVEDSNVQMNNIEGKLVESSEARRSILGIGADSDSTTPIQRAKMRKKAFDKLYAEKSPFPKTDPSKIYTFEFLQHLFNFQEFSIELGSMLGSIPLEDILDGQPLPLMACYAGEHPLWSFDIWNECLWERAKEYDALEQQTRAAQVESSAAN